MSGVAKIDITESEEVLKMLLAAQKTAFAKERIHALYELIPLIPNIMIICFSERLHYREDRWLEDLRD